MATNESKLKEQIAKLIHEEWVEWAKCIEHEVSEERRARWHSVYCKYEELSESEKNKDRVYVDKVIELLKDEEVL